MPNKYLIRHESVFSEGYVEIFSTNLSGRKAYRTIEDAFEHATKFRFLFTARIICWFLNKNDNYQTTVFSVVKIVTPKCFCGNAQDPRYTPCCSYECWHKKFEQ